MRKFYVIVAIMETIYSKYVPSATSYNVHIKLIVEAIKYTAFYGGEKCYY